jgi:hypothetical protein
MRLVIGDVIVFGSEGILHRIPVVEEAAGER